MFVFNHRLRQFLPGRPSQCEYRQTPAQQPYIVLTRGLPLWLLRQHGRQQLRINHLPPLTGTAAAAPQTPARPECRQQCQQPPGAQKVKLFRLLQQAAEHQAGFIHGAGLRSAGKPPLCCRASSKLSTKASNNGQWYRLCCGRNICGSRSVGSSSSSRA